MKFESDANFKKVEIGTLDFGTTFIDTTNFTQEEVLMVLPSHGYDCNVDFLDGVSTIAAVSLVSGEMWAYSATEEVIPVETEEVRYKIV